MAENDATQDDYQFTELDPLNPSGLSEEVTPSESPNFPGGSNLGSITSTKRNAMIAIGVFILAMLLYKFIGAYFSEKPQPAAPPAPVVEPPPQPAVQPSAVVEPAPAPTPTVAGTDLGASEVKNKLSSLQDSQDTMGSQITTLNGQLGNVNSTLQTLADKVTELNAVVGTLSTKLDEQSRQVELLTRKPTPPVSKIHVKSNSPLLKYRIQAVIPGRAWLVATNGSTVTVREGSRLQGYGIISLIDANRGRVTTSSGQVIGFGQEDS